MYGLQARFDGGQTVKTSKLLQGVAICVSVAAFASRLRDIERYIRVSTR